MRTFAIPAAVAAAIVSPIALFFGVGDYYPTILWWSLRSSLFVLVPLVALLVVVGVLAVLGAWREERDGNPLPAWAAAWLVGIVGLIALGWWSIGYHGYLQAKQYTPSISVTSAPLGELGKRAPYQVAEAQARPNLGDYPGDIATTSYIPQGDQYMSLVTRRGIFAGYQVLLAQSIPLTGRGSATTCQFDQAADARIGGWFSHNLGRQIAHEQRWWRFDPADAYAYCDGSRPVVVVPMTRQVGWMVVTERFAGVALYDGHTGRVEIVTDPHRIAALPGTAYPLSLATRQREATQALGSFGDWVFGRAGWETTEDQTDINSGNTAEFVLAEGRGAAYDEASRRLAHPGA
ncbi:MAG TPA: hypothetical protein VGJ13_05120 [Pseudonocardiaceae bacterium]|jgi:hypothetical protein